MAIINTLRDSSPLPVRDRGEMKINGITVFPGRDAERVLYEEFVMKFRAKLEGAVFFVGDNQRTLNLAVMPELIIGLVGLGEGGEQSLKGEDDIGTRRKLDIFNEDNSELLLRPGIEKSRDGTSKFGIQLTASNKKITEAGINFIPMEELSLDRELVGYLLNESIQGLFPGRNIASITDMNLKKLIEKGNGFKTLQELFPGRNIESIGNKTLLDFIAEGNGIKTLSQDYFLGKHREPQKVAKYLQDHFLQVDMFASGRSFHPTKEFLDYVLNPLNNKFRGGEFFGVSHIHYGWTDAQITKNKKLSRQKKANPGFAGYISPFDALVMLASLQRYQNSKKENLKISPVNILFGVTEIDITDRSLIGTWYFDLARMLNSKNIVDFNRFQYLTNQLNAKRQDGKLLEEFYELVARYSSRELPPYVTS